MQYICPLQCQQDADCGHTPCIRKDDAAYLLANIGGEIRSDGQEPAVALGSLVVPLGGMMDEVIPAP